MKIVFKKPVIKELKRLGVTESLRLAMAIAEELSDQPQRHKPLTGQLAGLRRLRVGDYRIVFAILNSPERVVVLRVGHRKDVYESPMPNPED
ncbi:MAG: type II toxin-antitoxin system RelE/ParE family toxin [Verrucomicrobiota bacterium]